MAVAEEPSPAAVAPTVAPAVVWGGDSVDGSFSAALLCLDEDKQSICVSSSGIFHECLNPSFHEGEFRVQSCYLQLVCAPGFTGGDLLLEDSLVVGL